MSNRCASCGRRFRSRPQNPNQKYCSRQACQNERRRRWRRSKLLRDPDYQANQKDSHKRWVEHHPGYYRQWRERHPEYIDRNRALQKDRDRRGRDLTAVAESGAVLAKSDACSNKSPILTVYYELLPVPSEDLAKSDASKRLFRLIPVNCIDYLAHAQSCKEITRGTLPDASATRKSCPFASP